MTELLDYLIQHMADNKCKLLLKENITTLRHFDEYNLMKGCSNRTRESQLRILILLTREVQKSFKSITKQDIDTYFTRLTTDDKIKVKPYTREQRRAVTCKFFKWLYEMKKIDEPPSVIHGILEPIKKAYDKTIDPSQLWTDEEVKKLVKYCTNLRDSAIIMTLYDSGCRISELLSMNIKDVQIEGDVCYIFLPDSKTEKRRVGLLIATPYLQQWLQHHPLKDNSNAPLFISFSPKSKFKRIKQHSTFEILQKVKELSGIKKKINHHIFRHSRISKCRKGGMPDIFVRRRHGYIPGSREIERYTWIDDEETDNAYRIAHGYDLRNLLWKILKF